MDYTSNPTNGEHTITMTAFIPTIPDEYKMGYRLSRTIRLLSVIDVVFGLFMLFFGNMGLYILIRILCSLCGYYGAKGYNYCLSSIYLTFLVFTTIAEILIIYVYQQQYQEGLITKDMLMLGATYQVLFFLLKLYIVRFSCKFLYFIKSLTHNSKTELIVYDTQPVEIVYW